MNINRRGIIHILPLILVTALIIAIAAGAYYFGMNSDRPLISKQEIDEVTIDESDEMSDWETFESKILGIKFKYPDQYVIKEESGMVKMLINLEKAFIDYGDFVFLEVTSTNIYQTGDSFYSCELTDNLYPCILESSIQTIQFNGIDAKTFYMHEGTVDAKYKIVKIDNPEIEFKMYVAGGGLEKTFNQILLTFEFVESEDVSDWETYVDEEFGFRFDYAENDSLSETIPESNLTLYNNIARRVVLGVKESDQFYFFINIYDLDINPLLWWQDIGLPSYRKIADIQADLWHDIDEISIDYETEEVIFKGKNAIKVDLKVDNPTQVLRNSEIILINHNNYLFMIDKHSLSDLRLNSFEFIN